IISSFLCTSCFFFSFDVDAAPRHLHSFPTRRSSDLSSAGTLPLTVDAAKKLNLNPGLYGFSLPLGATINMDGAAIRVGVSVIFAANIVGASLSFGNLLEIVLIGTLATIGTAGVP